MTPGAASAERAPGPGAQPVLQRLRGTTSIANVSCPLLNAREISVLQQLTTFIGPGKVEPWASKPDCPVLIYNARPEAYFCNKRWGRRRLRRLLGTASPKLS